MQNGKFIVITGPSTVGKTTVVNELLQRCPGSTRLVTTTTRAPRVVENDGVDYHFVEDDGVDYHFVSVEEFFAQRSRGEFFETAETYGNYYGSSKKKLEELLAAHPVVFSILDVKGARAVQEHIPGAIVIFLIPGSFDDLTRRLEERKSVSKEEIEKRGERAKHEIEAASEFDHIVQNIEGRFEDTVARIRDIISAS